MSQWISVNEKLPKELDKYLVFCKNKETCVAKFYPSTQKWWIANHEVFGGVTHWMPAPEFPKEDDTFCTQVPSAQDELRVLRGIAEGDEYAKLFGSASENAKRIEKSFHKLYGDIKFAIKSIIGWHDLVVEQLTELDTLKADLERLRTDKNNWKLEAELWMGIVKNIETSLTTKQGMIDRARKLIEMERDTDGDRWCKTCGKYFDHEKDCEAALWLAESEEL